LRLRLKEAMDGSSLIFCGIEFQIVRAANLKALRPTALAVKGTCNRLSEAERRVLGGLLRLISDERYEGDLPNTAHYWRCTTFTMTLTLVLLYEKGGNRKQDD